MSRRLEEDSAAAEAPRGGLLLALPSGRAPLPFLLPLLPAFRPARDAPCAEDARMPALPLPALSPA
jgi:hypothetical protein